MANTIEDLINQIYAEQGGTSYFDAMLGAAIEQARLNVADIDRSYGRGIEESNILYDESARNLLKQRDDTYEQNRGQFAGQGILRSGIFANEQGRVGEAYQRDLTSAAQRRTSSQADLTNQRLSGYNQIQGGLRGAQAEAANRYQQQIQADAQRRLEAQFQAQQAQQAAAAARRSGGGGGGYYSLENLFGQKPTTVKEQILARNPPASSIIRRF